VLVVRCEAPFPAVGEVLEAFAFPFVVNSERTAPLMPVSTNAESSTRSDGPPRAIGLGFQIAGPRLVGPRDMLGDHAFDDARRKARAAADYLGRHGPFAPHVTTRSAASLA
jgi:fructose 1,6-bisphosphate aldolase/phosphatase